MTTNIFMIAAILFFECRGEGFEGKKAVMATMINTGVTLDKKQVFRYSPWSRYREFPDALNQMTISEEIRAIMDKDDKDMSAWCECVEVALCRESFGPWTHFYNPKRGEPDWAKDLTDIKEIGNHIFGRLP